MNTNRKLMERKVKALLEGKTPPGVKYDEDNQGIQRTVYFDKRNRWVFKIGDVEENTKEYETAQKGKKLFANHELYRVPETLLIDGVIVMEYIVGTQQASNGAWWDEPAAADDPFQQWEDNHQSTVEKILGCGDVHGENVIHDGNFFYIVDMAY